MVKRDAAKLHSTIISVPPLVHVLPGVIDCGDSEARVLIFLVFVLVVPRTIPARSVAVIVACSAAPDSPIWTIPRWTAHCARAAACTRTRAFAASAPFNAENERPAGLY